MLEPEEFEFYDLLDQYREKFGTLPPTHTLEMKPAAELIRKALESGKPLDELPDNSDKL